MKVNSTLQLLPGFALLIALVSVFVGINPNHGTSPDSAVYLHIATDFSAYDGTFPIGYPALIWLVSWLTGLAPVWTSKLANLLAVGVSGALWANRLGPGRVGWLLSVWLLGQFVRIVAFTWSETMFLVLLAEVVWAMFQLENQPDSVRLVRLLALLIALFLVRYVGGFMAVLLLIMFRKSPKILAVGLAFSAFIIGYFVLNQQLTGSVWGGARFGPVEPLGVLAGLFGRALLNETLLIRDFLPGYDNRLVWLGVVLQTGWLVLVGRAFRELPRPTGSSQTRQLARLFLLTAGLYLLILFGLRIVSPFDAPNARLMAPATFCSVWAGLLYLSERPDYEQHLRGYWLVLVVLSWLELAPYGA